MVEWFSIEESRLKPKVIYRTNQNSRKEVKIKLVTRNAEKSFLSQSSFYFSDWMSRRVVARVQLSSCSNAKLKEHANYFPHSTENHSNTTVQLSYQENDHNLLTNGRPFVGERRMLWSRVVVHIPLKFECVKCSKLLSKKYMDNISCNEILDTGNLKRRDYLHRTSTSN